MTSHPKVYLGCIPDCLDIFSLKYRWFGALWEYELERKIVLGFWFGDNIQEIIEQVKKAGWHSPTDLNDPNEARSIYDYIRAHQTKQDWVKRSRLSRWTTFKKPWKDVQKGWYVICSGSDYPFYVAVLRRKAYSVWVEHVSICEEKVDLGHFIERVNQEHQINLQSLASDILRENVPQVFRRSKLT